LFLQMTVSPRLTVSVSGIGVVFENRSSDPVQSTVVLPHQFFECGLIPPAYERSELFITARRLGRLGAGIYHKGLALAIRCRGERPRSRTFRLRLVRTRRGGQGRPRLMA
jgi:hypothetical protein